MHAIYHLHLTPLSRSEGRSSVQMASYVAGLTMLDERTSQTHFRRDTEAVITYGLVGSSLKPEEFFNLAEKAEKRRDSVVGRHIETALPRGLSSAVEVQILQEFAAFLSELLHTVVLWARHLNADATKPDNPHGHFLVAARPWDDAARCFAAKKDRLLDSRDTGSHAVERIRRAWEEIVNQRLPEEYSRIDRRSHVRRGNGRHARRHLGRKVAEWKRRNPGKLHPNEEFNCLVEKHTLLGEELAECEREISELGRLIEAEALAAKEREQHQAMSAEAHELLAPMRRNAGAESPSSEVLESCKLSLSATERELLIHRIAAKEATAPLRAQDSRVAAGTADTIKVYAHRTHPPPDRLGQIQ